MQKSVQNWMQKIHKQDRLNPIDSFEGLCYPAEIPSCVSLPLLPGKSIALSLLSAPEQERWIPTKVAAPQFDLRLA